jgi:hypothetical protein
LEEWKVTEIRSSRMKKCRIAFHMYNSAARSSFPVKMQSTRKANPDKKCCGKTIEYIFYAKMFTLLILTIIP